MKTYICFLFCLPLGNITFANASNILNCIKILRGENTHLDIEARDTPHSPKLTPSPKVTPPKTQKEVNEIRRQIEDIIDAKEGEDAYKNHIILPPFGEEFYSDPKDKNKVTEQKQRLEELFKKLYEREKQLALESPEKASAFLKKAGINVEIEQSESNEQSDRALVSLSPKSLDEEFRYDIRTSNQDIRNNRLEQKRKLQRPFAKTIFGQSEGEKWDLFEHRDSLRSLEVLRYIKELENKFLEEDALAIADKSLSEQYGDIHTSTMPPRPSRERQVNLTTKEGERFKENLSLLQNSIDSLGEDRKTGEVLPEAQLTPQERTQLRDAALKILTKNGENSSNAQHLGDHLNLLKNPTVAAELKKAGIDIEDAKLLVLLHDLGKEYDQLPQEYKETIEQIFPKPKNGAPDSQFLNRNIMAHEFGSMAMIDRLCADQNIAPAKRDRLKALIAGHNAGYGKLGEGFHFWQEMWPKFAKEMSDKGASVPTEYPALKSTLLGQNPLTIVLTAADRLASKTLASQEKFADTLVKTGKWNNQSLADQMANSLKNVQSEGDKVLSKLEAFRGKDYEGLKKAIQGHFGEADQNLAVLSERLPQMASGTGAYKDRPALSESEKKDSVVYCQEKLNSKGNKERTWFRIDSSGKVFRFEKKLLGFSGKWVEATEISSSATGPSSPTQILFGKFIYPDLGYSAPKLSKDLL
jgi:hypothetical protein